MTRESIVYTFQLYIDLIYTIYENTLSIDLFYIIILRLKYFNTTTINFNETKVTDFLIQAESIYNCDGKCLYCMLHIVGNKLKIL